MPTSTNWLTLDPKTRDDLRRLARRIDELEARLGEGGGEGNAEAEYALVSADADLPNHRVLTAGTNITLTDGGAGGNLIIDAAGGGGGNLTAPYILEAADGTLPNHRVLTAGADISITDGGASGPITISSTAPNLSDALLGQLWAPPALRGLTPHADDEEFLGTSGTTTPTPWQWFLQSQVGGAAHDPMALVVPTPGGNDIEPWPTPPYDEAGLTDQQCGALVKQNWGANRRSWVQWMVPDQYSSGVNTAVSITLFKPLTAVPPAASSYEYYTGMRVHHNRDASGQGPNGSLFWWLTQDNGGGPDNGSNRMRVSLSQFSSDGLTKIRFLLVVNGSVFVNSDLSECNFNEPTGGPDGFSFVKNMANGGTYNLFALWNYGRKVLLWTGGTGGTDFRPAWTGYQGYSAAGGLPRPIFEVDYFRRVVGGVSGWGT
jgi:hypothetical protein